MTIIVNGQELPEPFLIDDERVKEVLEELEFETIDGTGIGKISGGFAKAEIKGFDEEYFDVELKWGVQSDCTNNVHTEQYKIDRLSLVIQDA